MDIGLLVQQRPNSFGILAPDELYLGTCNNIRLLLCHIILTKQWVFEVGQFNGVIEICPRLALVATVTNIWNSTSNNEIIVYGLYGKRIEQNKAYFTY